MHVYFWQRRKYLSLGRGQTCSRCFGSREILRIPRSKMSSAVRPVPHWGSAGHPTAHTCHPALGRPIPRPRAPCAGPSSPRQGRALGMRSRPPRTCTAVTRCVPATWARSEWHAFVHARLWPKAGRREFYILKLKARRCFPLQHSAFLLWGIQVGRKQAYSCLWNGVYACIITY